MPTQRSSRCWLRWWPCGTENVHRRGPVHRPVTDRGRDGTGRRAADAVSTLRRRYCSQRATNTGAWPRTARIRLAVTNAGWPWLSPPTADWRTPGRADGSADVGCRRVTRQRRAAVPARQRDRCTAERLDPIGRDRDELDRRAVWTPGWRQRRYSKSKSCNTWPHFAAREISQQVPSFEGEDDIVYRTPWHVSDTSRDVQGSSPRRRRAQRLSSLVRFSACQPAN